MKYVLCPRISLTKISSMEGELARVITSDGLELQGFYAVPEQVPSRTTLLHVHGLSGNFYENRFVDNVGAAAVAAGVNFLTINTRGHEYISDFICECPAGTTNVQVGGVFETFEDCQKDIQAWVDFARTRGAERIILEGHSHGAIKATYFLGQAADPAISGLVLLSPSDDFGLQRYRMGRRFDEILGIAKKMVDEGKGSEFLPRDYFHCHISAATYYDTFRPNSRLKIFNISMTDTHHFREIESVRVPVLIVVGSVEEAFVGRPDEFLADVRRRLKKTKDVTGHVLDGAPHNYLGFEADLGGHVESWLRSHFEGSA
jgi:pimeloyl-ACP methyl ester carboxylesterase